MTDPFLSNGHEYANQSPESQLHQAAPYRRELPNRTEQAVPVHQLHWPQLQNPAHNPQICYPVSNWEPPQQYMGDQNRHLPERLGQLDLYSQETPQYPQESNGQSLQATNGLFPDAGGNIPEENYLADNSFGMISADGYAGWSSNNPLPP